MISKNVHAECAALGIADDIISIIVFMKRIFLSYVSQIRIIRFVDLSFRTSTILTFVRTEYRVNNGTKYVTCHVCRLFSTASQQKDY